MSDVNENILKSVSVNLLYDGMVLQDDIYDSTGDRLLLTSGNVIDDSQIENIISLNNGSYTIYVTGRTHEAMVSRKPEIEVESHGKIEEVTGYTEKKDETFKLLEEIAQKKAVSMESMKVLSHDLSARLDSTPPAVIISLINAMAPVDEYLQRHSVNVSFLNGLVGRWMGLSAVEVDKLVLIGLMHDCGKTMLPPKVLNAPRKLTSVEYEVIKMHAKYTYDLLSEFPEPIRIAASSHHERLNGGGYPKRLASGDVILEARITAISDTYDAMVSQRVYQGPQSPFSVMAKLENMSKNELDSTLIRIFLENMPKELVDKPVKMSDGTIGIVCEYDANDIEFPNVALSGRVIKTNRDIYCVTMYNND